MMPFDLVYIFLAFFILGFVIATIGLLFARFRYSIHGRRRRFSTPAKYTPNLDLTHSEPQASVDNSTAHDNFNVGD